MCNKNDRDFIQSSNNEGTSFIVLLTTIGRKTGKKHTVALRVVNYHNKLYFSRRNSDSDWLQNMLINSTVVVKYNNKMYHGKSKLINNKQLMRKISEIKYYGDMRSQEPRIILEVTLF